MKSQLTALAALAVGWLGTITPSDFAAICAGIASLCAAAFYLKRTFFGGGDKS